MQKRTLFAALSLAAVTALGIPLASAQTTKDKPAAASEKRAPSGRNGVDATSSQSGYPGSSTSGGAQNQPRNGGATGSAGKAPNDGHAPVNPTSRANRNGAATGS